MSDGEKTEGRRGQGVAAGSPPSGNRSRQEEESAPFRGDVTIELGDNRNRRFRWAPTQDDLDGHWLRANLQADEMVEETVGMPDIPGMRIRVNGRDRRLEIFDPLTLSTQSELRQEVLRRAKAFQGQEQTTRQNKVIDEASETKIKTWLYWMRRLVDGVPVDPRVRGSGGPQARVVEGTLPSLADILRLPGKVRIQHGTQSTLYARYLEDYEQIREE